MKRILSALFLLCFNVAFTADVNDLDPELVKKLKDLNHSKPAETEIIKDKTLEKRVGDFNEKVMPDLLNRVKEYRGRIASEYGYEDKQDESCYEKRELGEADLFVFISSSVPEETLKTYADGMKKLPGAVMVLNGVIGGASKIMPTVDLITRISCGKNVDELKKDNTDCKMVRADINL